MACRSAAAGKNGIGPSLAGVFGRKSGSRTTTLARTDTASQQALDEATNEEAAARADVAEIGENVRGPAGTRYFGVG